MGILEKRVAYKPFEYPTAHEFNKKQQRVHWIPEDISLASDITDFKSNHVTKDEQTIIGTILKSFTQMETFVEKYWSRKIASWFPKPEIEGMAITLASFEVIHEESYSLVNENLQLNDFEAFLQDPEVMAIFNYLVDTPGNTKEEKFLSIAVYSGFTEGVFLFSSFAILMSFQLRNLFKGVAQIVEYSVRDETLHSNAGCWIARTFLEEYQDEMDMELLEKSLYEASLKTIELETNLIDQIFDYGNRRCEKIDTQLLSKYMDIPEGVTEIDIINPANLKNFIIMRVNQKLHDLGFGHLATHEYNKERAEYISNWFTSLTVGKIHTDFFANRVTNYSKSTQDWNDL